MKKAITIVASALLLVGVSVVIIKKINDTKADK